MNTLAIKFAALAVLIAGIWFHGHHMGAKGVQADWDAAELDRERQIQIHEAQARRRAADASGGFERQRARITQALPAIREGLRQDLQAPACQKDAHESLADLPIPAAAVDRLRNAGTTLHP